jgi:hypothetical protein
VSLDLGIAKDSPLEITNHGSLDYLQPIVNYPDASLDLKFLMENKMVTLTSS